MSKNVIDIQYVASQVRRNCEISDAQYVIEAGERSEGVQSRLKSRFREEEGIKPWKKTDENDYSDWVSDQRPKWKSLYSSMDKNEPFPNIEINGRSYHPSEKDAINEKLIPAGYFYSASRGYSGKIEFLLAKIEETWPENGFNCFLLNELATDMNNANYVAFLQDKNICGKINSTENYVWGMIAAAKVKYSDFSDLDEHELVLLRTLADCGLPESELKKDPKKIARKVDRIATDYLKCSMAHELGHGLVEEKEILPEELILKIIKLDPGAEIGKRVGALNEVLADTIKTDRLNGRLAHIIKNKDESALGFSAFKRVRPHSDRASEYESQLWSPNPLWEGDTIHYNSHLWWNLYWKLKETSDWKPIEAIRKKTYKRAVGIATGLKELDKEDLEPDAVQEYLKNEMPHPRDFL